MSQYGISVILFILWMCVPCALCMNAYNYNTLLVGIFFDEYLVSFLVLLIRWDVSFFFFFSDIKMAISEIFLFNLTH